MSAVLRYEWLRVTTVRSTWVLIGLGIALPAVLAFFLAWAGASFVNSGRTDGGPPDGNVFSPLGLNPATVLLMASLLVTVGAVSFGQEYRHGLIRITLALFPKRSNVFWGKVIMVTAVVAATSVAAIAAVALGDRLGLLVGDASFDFDTSTAVRLIGQTVLVITLFALFAFAITALSRNQPLGILVPIVGAAVVEPIILAIAGIQNWTWIDWVLPFSGALEAIESTGAESWGHLAVFTVWVLALLIPSWILFVRRDA
ncbi:MAG: hypothetical protein ACYYNF_02825 [Actinomycetes bacterium]|nr:ABC transporter permease [Candidatus Nanopelagicales bacterium]MDP4825451.1 ABC transporter permease [Candidatus Nanopelagicales bacterium]MDP4887937.1 ABC transporter permease [Candidatus Nanopelagicales bacterium]